MIASHRESAHAWKTTPHPLPGLGELRSSKPGAFRRRRPHSGWSHCFSPGSGTTVTTGSARCATSSLSAFAKASPTAATREAQAKLAQIELKLAEFQNQQIGLETLYQELSRNRDEWVIAEIEQILTIASQQLQLTGNVKVALYALPNADARLARSGRPQFLPLRRVFSRDIERLKTAPSLDVPGFAAKLEQLIAGVDSLPLVQEARPRATSAPKREADGLWERLVAELLGELKQLVRIENMEGSDPALLSPPQAFFLRENLKLRLLNARLALLARDEAAYHGDVKVAASWLERYFDTRSRAAVAMAVALKQLGSGSIGVSLPTLGESLAAVRAYKPIR